MPTHWSHTNRNAALAQDQRFAASRNQSVERIAHGQFYRHPPPPIGIASGVNIKAKDNIALTTRKSGECHFEKPTQGAAGLEGRADCYRLSHVLWAISSVG